MQGKDVVDKEGVPESSEADRRKVAEKCAIVLCRIARDRGDDEYQFYQEVRSESTNNELWQVAVTRIDNQPMH